MRKRRSRHSKLRPARIETPMADIHLRLCHRCFYLNESSQAVPKCLKCERPFSDEIAKSSDEVPIDRDSPESLDESDPILEAMSEFDNGNETDHARNNVIQIKTEEDEEAEDDAESEAEQKTGVNGLAVRW